MRRRMTRLMAAALVLVMILGSGSALGAGRKFASVKYEPVDIRQMQAVADEILTLCADEKNAERVLTLFDTLLDMFDTSETMTAYSMVMYSSDITSEYWAAQYALQRDSYARISNCVVTTARSILTSPCAKAALAGWDSATLQRARSTRAYDESQLAAFENENGLLTKYYALLATTRPGSEDRKQKLGGLFIDLMRVRKQMAASFGYETFADYAYRSLYGRDYSPAQAEKLCEQVKGSISGLYKTLCGIYPDRVKGLGAVMDSYSREELIKKVQQEAPAVSEDAAKCLDALLRDGYYSVNASGKKAASSFTVLLPDEESPYMFIASDETPFDLTTMTHELGHCTYYSLYPVSSWYGEVSVDLAEIHSTAMQLLFTDRYDEMFGEENGSKMKDYTVFQTLYCLVSGCFYDEFQRKAYAMAEPTVAGLEKLYNELLKDYGLDDGGVTHWTELPHNFEDPFYYISYAVSAAGGWEIWLISQTEPERAKEIYAKLLRCSFNTERGYALKRSGLSDPMDGSFGLLTKRIEALLLYNVPFTDVAGHWAAEYISWLAGEGAVSGVTPTTFAPGAKMTRAMFVTVLGRLYGEQKSGDTGFTDVKKGSYYEPWVAWAAEKGIITGSNGRFRPEDTISRQEMAVIILRLLESEGEQIPERESSYADKEQIADWAKKAASALSALGVLEGKSGNRFDPKGLLTRAESAAVLYRMNGLVKGQ